MSESVRKVETGEDADGNKTYEYQLGGEVEGHFVPFVTKSAGYVEHLRDREASSKEGDEPEPSEQ